MRHVGPTHARTPLSARFALLVLGALFLLRAGPVLAQAQVEAAVDVDRLSTDQRLTLTLRIRGAGELTPPDMDAVAGFEVVGSSSASQYSLGSGGFESTNILTYQLRPTQLGELTIGPLELVADGQTLRTPGITVTVVPGRQPTVDPAARAPAPGGPLPVSPPGSSPSGDNPSPDQPYTLSAEAGPLNPYVGEQVAYTLRVFQWSETGVRARYQAPDFAGFWNASPEPERSQNIRDQGGRPARVTEFRSLLFPTRTGALSIEAAGLTVPASFWGAGFNVASEPITLDVRPLPEGAPAEFDGAVGRYSISAQADAAEVAAGEPLRLVVTVAGQGNIETLPEPHWPQLPAGWRWIPGQSNAQQEAKGGVVNGSRSIERFVVPAAAGAAEIPSIPFAYFEPGLERYQVARTAPIAVNVLPRADGAPVETASSATVAETAAAVDWQAPGQLSLGPLTASAPLAQAAAAAYGAGDRVAAAAALEVLLQDGPGSRAEQALAQRGLGQTLAAQGAGQRGRARLAWERAQRLTPRDPGLQADLQSLVAGLPDAARSDGVGLPAVLQRSRGWLTDRELGLAAAALMALALVLALAGRRRVALWDAALLTALLAAAVLGLGGLRRWEDRFHPRAFVLRPEAPLLTAPGPAAQVDALTTLPEGLPVRLGDHRAGYVQVEVPGLELSGWLAEGDAEAVSGSVSGSGG
ncbi:MAG: BatD family protein [Anaerolineae bacterium]